MLAGEALSPIIKNTNDRIAAGILMIVPNMIPSIRFEVLKVTDCEKGSGCIRAIGIGDRIRAVNKIKATVRSLFIFMR